MIPEVDTWKCIEEGFAALYKTKDIAPAQIIDQVLKAYPVEDIRMKEPTIEEIIEKYYIL